MITSKDKASQTQAVVTLELRVEHARKGTRSAINGAIYSWDGCLVHLAARNKAAQPVVLLNRYMAATPTGFEILDKMKKLKRSTTHKTKGLSSMAARRQFGMVELVPNAFEVIDTLFVIQNGKKSEWGFTSDHWTWGSIKSRERAKDLTISGWYAPDSKTLAKLKKSKPKNLITSRLLSPPISLELGD